MNLIPKPDALRQLEALIDTATQGADPAPWFDAEGTVQTWGGDPRQHKLQAATKISAIAALLTGDLLAFSEVDGEWQPVPSWGWQFASWSMFQINWPVRLGDDFTHWRGTLATHFDRDGYKQWLAGYEFAPLSPDDLPPSLEIPPPYAERSLLPDTGTVTLSECVSWAAWQFALIGREMMDAIDQGEFGVLGEQEMRGAFELVIAKAKAGSLHPHGRFQANHRGDKAGSRKLELPDLMDFARFNPIDEALERGTGYAWDGAAFDAVFAKGGGFVDIEIPRDQVLTAFPDPREAPRQPPESDGSASIDPNAAPVINKDKSDADVVAKHIRKNGGTIAAALRQVVPAATRGRDLRGTHDAIRRALGYYYKKDGFPKN